MKVLIADDSILMRERLREMIAEVDGVDAVYEAEDGIEATDFIQRLKPDVVILDIRMPKRNGIKVLESIEKGGWYPVVIVLTSYPEYRKKCIEAGAHFFFDKSTEFHKVVEVLNRLARKTNMLQDC